jgi:hypothetical protein
MDKLYHVFISSTYSDLKDERKRVSESIAKAGYVPEGMELFPASSKKQFEFIKRVIDRCDYYVVIIGGRYGTLADDNISYTEQEYNYAISRNMPTLAFLHRSPERIEIGKVDTDHSNSEKLAIFRERLKNSAMVDFWDDPASLATAVVIAVGQEQNINPGIGWVRGDQASDPRVLEELATARETVEELKAQIAKESKGKISFDPELAPVDEKFTVEMQIVDYDYIDGKRVEKGKEQFRVDVTWHNIFLLATSNLTHANEESIIYSNLLSRLSFGKLNDRSGEHQDITAALSSRQIRFQLEALGLIRAEVEMRDRPAYDLVFKNRAIQRPITVWRLTEKGRNFLSQSLALRKNRDFVSESQ